MTDPIVDAQSDVSPETSRPERVVAKPHANSRLEALHAQYKPLKEKYEQAKREYDELKRAIAAELESEYTGDERPSHAYEIPASIYGPALVVYYKSQEYMPDASIRENFPAIWAAFKREKRFSEVRESQVGKPRGKRK